MSFLPKTFLVFLFGLANEPSRLLFYFCLFFIAGIVSSEYLFLFLPFLLLLFFKPAFILLLAFLAGFFYPALHQNEFVLPLFEGEEITVQGTVIREDKPVVALDERNENFYLHTEGDLNYGTVVSVRGEPVSFPQGMQTVMHKDRISVSFFDPEIEILGQKNNFRSYIFSLRRVFAKKIDQGVSYPNSAVLKAVLLGDRTDISDQLREKFSVVGVAHLLAVSGTHIVIIAGLFLSLASLLQVKRKFLFSFSLLFLFIILVGAPPSAIRAGIMGSLFILAQKNGRKSTSIRSLIFVASLMLIFHPSLINDIGFRLSFLAAAGIILFASKLKTILTTLNYYRTNSFFSKLKEKIVFIFSALPNFVSDTLAITLSAQFFVLPLVWYYFGNIPFLAPLSNLIIAPLLPIIMFLGVAGLLLAFLVGQIAFFPVQLLLAMVIFLVDLFYLVCSLC